MAAGTPGDVELDLDDDGAAPSLPPAPPPSRRSRAGWAVGGLVVGLLLGRAALPAGAPEAAAPSPSPSPSASPAAPVSLVFGAHAPWGAADMPTRVGHRISVPVPAVVVNETSAPLVVRALRVTGPGAGLAANDFAMDVTFPLHLPPGEAMDLPFRLTSDCTVPVRPLPRITLVVAPDDGSAGRPVDVRLPDLGSLWGRTLDPSLCAG